MAQVNMHMELRPDGDEVLAWDLKAESMVEMVSQAKRICKEHNRKFTPHDVLVWENQENIEARKKTEAKAEAQRKREEEKAAEILVRAQAKKEAELEAAAERLLAKREAEAKKGKKEKMT